MRFAALNDGLDSRGRRMLNDFRRDLRFATRRFGKDRAPPTSAVVAVRARSDATKIVTLLRESVRVIDPELPIYRVRPMEQALQERSTWFPLIDRNLGKFMDIYRAGPSDYRVTTQRVLPSAGSARESSHERHGR